MARVRRSPEEKDHILRLVIDNPDKSYAEIGKMVGITGNYVSQIVFHSDHRGLRTQVRVRRVPANRDTVVQYVAAHPEKTYEMCAQELDVSRYMVMKIMRNSSLNGKRRQQSGGHALARRTRKHHRQSDLQFQWEQRLASENLSMGRGTRNWLSYGQDYTDRQLRHRTPTLDDYEGET